jgi:UDP-N-acetylmuramate--alanine ligase
MYVDGATTNAGFDRATGLNGERQTASRPGFPAANVPCTDPARFSKATHSALAARHVNDFAGARVHLIGIGGSGMSGAASMLVALGARVSGSDLVAFPGMGELVRLGVRVNVGHSAALLDDDVDVVVASAAIPDNNPELVIARQRGLPMLRYADLLGVLSRSYQSLAVAGTHGKSTTTAMTAHLMREAGLDPSFIVGARSAQLGGSSHIGSGTHMVIESCEYNRSFLQLRPGAAAILNVEPDHLDCYRTLEAIVDAFAEFAALPPTDGLVVYNADEPLACRAAESARARMGSFGFGDDADWRASNLVPDCGRFSFDVSYRGRFVLSTRLSIPGRHNVANALAAIALTHHAGAETPDIARALVGFQGVERRLTWRGEGGGVTVLDDYAHHPTEVRVTLEAVKHRYNPKRMWVVFQPHQYSRTRDFMDVFAESFALADEVIINDIYGARESDPEVCRLGAEELARRIQANGRPARYLSSLEDVTGHLLAHFSMGDVVLTMGAGDIWKVADELVARICRPHEARCAAGA